MSIYHKWYENKEGKNKTVKIFEYRLKNLYLIVHFWGSQGDFSSIKLWLHHSLDLKKKSDGSPLLLPNQTPAYSGYLLRLECIELFFISNEKSSETSCHIRDPEKNGKIAVEQQIILSCVHDISRHITVWLYFYKLILRLASNWIHTM